MQSRIRGHVSRVVAVSLRRMNPCVTIAKSLVRGILKNQEVLQHLEMSLLKLTDETSQNKCAAESEKTCITLQSGMSQQFPTTPFPKKAETLWKMWIKTRMWSFEKEPCWQSPHLMYRHLYAIMCITEWNQRTNKRARAVGQNHELQTLCTCYLETIPHTDCIKSSHKGRPEPVDCPLVVRCGIGHKPVVNYIRWSIRPI